jgi:hypothetical protein
MEAEAVTVDAVTLLTPAGQEVFDAVLSASAI